MSKPNEELPPLDIDAIKKDAAEAEGRPFLIAKDPEKDMTFAYRVTIDGEFRKFTSPKDQREKECIDVIVINAINDDEAPKGKATLLCTRKVLKNKLLELNVKKGDIVDIMSVGKPKDKKYYDYRVLKRSETFSLSQLGP